MFDLSQLPSMVAQIKTDLELNLVGVYDQTGLEAATIPLSKQAVELILREVLENAQKFHPQQTPAVEILILTLNNQQNLRIQVIDDGLTLSPEQLTQVWVPYYQGEKYFTGETTGMGLGLSRVALLIWGAGGTCRLYNRDSGPGIVVEFILPLATSDKNTNT